MDLLRNIMYIQAFKLGTLYLVGIHTGDGTVANEIPIESEFLVLQYDSVHRFDSSEFVM